MTMLDAFHREFNDFEMATARAPTLIRVTTDALRGSIVTVPCRYEHDDGSREVDEIRVHPQVVC